MKALFLRYEPNKIFFSNRFRVEVKYLLIHSSTEIYKLKVTAELTLLIPITNSYALFFTMLAKGRSYSTKQ
jgi:hypothetical protein